MLPELLPTWEEAENAVKSGKATILDTFIYEQENAGIEGVRFRNQLRELIALVKSESSANKLQKVG